MSFFLPQRRLEFVCEAYYPEIPEWRDITVLMQQANINFGDVSRIGTGSFGGDGVVRIASFKFQNNQPTDDDIHPRHRGSSWNSFGSGYDPLFKPGRRIRLWVKQFTSVSGVVIADPADDFGLVDPVDGKALTVNEASRDPVIVFDGFIGDEISGNEHTLSVTARDGAQPFMDMFFEDGFTSVTGTPSSVMQDLIDTIMPVDHRLTVVVDGVESFTMLGGWEPRDMSVWHALQLIAGSVGWLLSFEIVSNVPSLVFREPPRSNSVADYQLDGDDIYINNLAQSSSEVRNVVHVDYNDGSNLQRVTVQDPGSITDLSNGVPKIIVLGGELTSMIQTSGDALTLANAVLHDLSDVYYVVTATLPLFPEVRLYDLLDLATPLLSGFAEYGLISEDETWELVDESETWWLEAVEADNVAYSVASIQHIITGGDKPTLETRITGTGRVIGRRNWWLEGGLG